MDKSDFSTKFVTLIVTNPVIRLVESRYLSILIVT